MVDGKVIPTSLLIIFSPLSGEKELKRKEIYHVNNGRRINSFTTLTLRPKVPMGFFVRSRSIFFAPSTSPNHRLLRAFFMQERGTMTERVELGGIVIDHATGGKARKDTKKGRNFYEFFPRRRLHTQNINSRIVGAVFDFRLDSKFPSL